MNGHLKEWTPAWFIVVVIMDYFCKWAETYAKPNLEASTILHFHKRYNLTKEAILNRNSYSRLLIKLCDTLKIRKTPTQRCILSSMERVNGTINRQNCLRSPNWLEEIIFIYFCWPIVQSLDQDILSEIRLQTWNGDDYVSNLRNKRAKIHQRTRLKCKNAGFA